MKPDNQKELASLRGQIAANSRWAKAERRLPLSAEDRQARNEARVAEQRAKLAELKERAAS